MDDEEAQWIELTRQGDPYGITMLYNRYVDRIYRYALIKLGEQHEAEDLAEHVFLRMIESIGQFRHNEGTFAAWLYRIAHNLIVDQLRLRSRRAYVPIETLEQTLVSQFGDPYASAEAAEFRRHIAVALTKLTDLQAQVISLRFGAGLSNAETARLLGRTENAIKALQYTALKNLYNLLHELQPDARPTRGQPGSTS